MPVKGVYHLSMRISLGFWRLVTQDERTLLIYCAYRKEVRSIAYM